jgi:hypothetical protein
VSQAALAPSASGSTRASDAPELRFLGTLVSIEPAPLAQNPRRWVVTARVDRVLAGSLSEPRFAFRVHSPARAGLQVGQQREIRAQPIDGGYVVDELQWISQPRR